MPGTEAAEGADHSGMPKDLALDGTAGGDDGGNKGGLNEKDGGWDPGDDAGRSGAETGTPPAESPPAAGPADAAPRKDGAVQRGTGSQQGSRDQVENGAADHDGGAVKVVANPHDVAVLVNKTYRLPDGYRPADLVEPDVPFIFSEKSEKRLLRKEAAEALEALFAAAKADGVELAGVSGFRSHETQRWLFDHYVKTYGEAEASRFSARPGHSEHQTGLAIDVSGIDGKCAAEDCFAGTKEARWLAEHAHEYGFIIRYPEGKEAVTGYKYEPWHLRYVGKQLARTLVESGLTLDEYLAGTVPVSNESP